MCCLERHHRHARNSTMSSSYMPPGVPPRSSRVHRPSPGRIRRALRDATARPASYPNRTRPGHGVEVLTQQSNGGKTTSTVSTANRWGSRCDGRQWPHMPSSVLGDVFGQAQDSGIISWTRVLALDSALSSGKHATINWGGGQPRHPVEGHNGETDHILAHQGSRGMCCWGVSAKCVIAQIREVYGERTGVTKNIEFIARDTQRYPAQINPRLS